MKSLVLAEKPSVGREIARVLGCRDNRKYYLEGPKYVVTWALGHLVELAEPEDYDRKYAVWNLDDLPILPKKMKLKRIRETNRQLQVIERLAKRRDLKELIIATDAGREGELVARWIMELVRWSKPFKRLWISSQTDQAIREGFQKLKPGKEYDRLYASAVSRAEADWLIGLNITRALTCKYNIPLSAGRVQSPTLAMLVEREKEIESFRSETYHTVEIDLGPFRATWRHPASGDARIFDSTQAEALKQKLTGTQARIVKLKTLSRTEPQPLPYDLTELQRDANRRYGFSAKKTSSVLQSLYERHKTVTYPRTDSRYLSTDMLSTMKERLLAMRSGPYERWINGLGKFEIQAKRVINNAKVTDHHAIIPTEQPLRWQDLDADERKLYDLIAKRFIALFLPPARYDEMKLTLEAAGETFTAAGKIERETGWKSVYESDSPPTGDDPNRREENDLLQQQADVFNRSLPPNLKQGQSYPIMAVNINVLQTTPPPRFTEATLLTMMEKHQLGTPATRADIIEKLLQADAIERKGNTLIPTPKGKQLIELVTEDLRSPELTATWERELEKIAKGKADMHDFLRKIRKRAAEMVEEVKTSEQKYKPFNATHSHCPKCGKMLQQVNRKRGKMLICINGECGYQRSLEKVISQRRCPQCHRKMELREGKAGKFVHCRQCNVIEKLEEGMANKKQQRRETEKLLKKYGSSSFGTSLGEALKKALAENDGEHV